MFTAESLSLLQAVLQKNQQADLNNYEEIVTTQTQIKSLEEETNRVTLDLNKQMAATQISLADVERELRNLPTQVVKKISGLFGGITRIVGVDVNIINQYRDTERRLLETRDNLTRALTASSEKSTRETAVLQQNLILLNQRKDFLKKENEAINFWLDRHIGKPLKSGLHRLEERLLSVERDIVKLTSTNFSMNNLSDSLNHIGGQVSKEWKKLPHEVQLVLIVACSIAVGYGAVYLLVNSGVQVSFSLAVAQQGLAVNVLTYTVGGGIQVFPAVCALAGGAAAWQAFEHQSREEDFIKNKALDAELQMRKEKEDLSKKLADDMGQQIEAAEKNANTTSTNPPIPSSPKPQSQQSLLAYTAEQNKLPPVTMSSNSAVAEQTSSAPMASASTVVAEKNTDKEMQLLSTVEMIYKDVTCILSYVAPLASNILIIGKALLESDSIGEPNNPYQKIISKAIDEVVDIIIRDPYVKTLVSTTRNYAEFLWNFIGPEIEKKLEEKGVSVKPGSDGTIQQIKK